METVQIFDTTLRDGEQSAHASLTQDEKLRIAKQLEKLGVDIIEAGFPISSQGDFEAVRKISETVRKPTICALARAIEGEGKDIHRAWQAIRYAAKPRLHTFIATSPIHMKYKLQKKEDEVLKMAIGAVRYARDLVGSKGDVEFSPEDATRSEPKFLYKVIRSAIDSGANVINIPDTTGYAVPAEFDKLIAGIQKKVRNIDQCTLSVHCHNDLGLAVANSLQVVKNRGVRQVECTINGIGERAGNTSLEEVAAGIDTRSDFYGISTGIKKEEIGKTSKLVSRLTGIPVQPNKAIVGGNAFSHSSGIHQDGVTKRVETYEIIDPKKYGWVGETLIITSRSGKTGIENVLKKLDYELTPEELALTCKLVKDLGDKKKQVFPEDLVLIVEDEVRKPPQVISLDHYTITSGNGRKLNSTASVSIKRNGKTLKARVSSSGPIDALYKAIDRAAGLKAELKHYDIRSVTAGKSSIGEVTVKIGYNRNSYLGRGSSTNILEASAKAYINAMNKIVLDKNGSKKGYKYSRGV